MSLVVGTNSGHILEASKTEEESIALYWMSENFKRNIGDAHRRAEPSLGSSPSGSCKRPCN